MDLSCKYIDVRSGYCLSPEAGDMKIQCFCSNYKLCIYFPKEELKDIIKPEKLRDLEKGINKQND